MILASAWRALRDAIHPRDCPEYQKVARKREIARESVKRQTKRTSDAALRGVNDNQVVISTLKQTLQKVGDMRNGRESDPP